MMRETIIESSGNVFTDLGFDEAEAAILHMRAKLMSDLRLYIQSRRLSESEIATRFGITRARVNDLQNGKWEHFSLETLITLETRIGRQVTLQLAG